MSRCVKFCFNITYVVCNYLKFSFVFQDKNWDLMNKIWCDIDKSTCNEEGVIDRMLLTEKSANVTKDYLYSGHVNKNKEKSKRALRDNPTDNVDQSPSKKSKFACLTTEETLKILNISNSERYVQTVLSSILAEDVPDDNENPCTFGFDITRRTRKPCATVESEQSKEIEPIGETNATDDNVEAGEITSSDTPMLIDVVACEEIEMSETSKICDGDQHPPEDQLQQSVFEEIIISQGEISQGEASSLVFLDLNGQVNIPDNILNTVTVSQETEQVVPLVGNPASANPPNPQNCERPLVSSEGQPYLSLGRRDDCFSYNETMLARFLSESNADEGTDDESNYVDRRKYAGGGKVIAFREQQEDSKSDVGEECASPPSSRTDSHRSVEPPSPAAPSQHAFVDAPTHLTETQYNSFRGVIVSLTDIASHQEMTDKTQFAVQKTGMSICCLPLHFRTVERYHKYLEMQSYYFELYYKTPDVLLCEICPTPFVALKVNEETYCHCLDCMESYEILQCNWHQIIFVRLKKIELDQKQVQTVNLITKYEAKLVDPVDEVKQSKILDIADKISAHCEVSNLAPAPESDQRMTSTVPERIKNTNDTKTEYSSLPPKKRKAFNLLLSESMAQEELANPEPKKSKTNFQSQDEMPLDHRLKESENSLPDNDSIEKPDLSKDCSVVVNRMTPNRLTGVVIKTVDGKFVAEPKTSSTTEFSDDNSDEGKVRTKKKHSKKSHCRHQKKKEERRLQKAIKRLERQKRREERMLNDSI